MSQSTDELQRMAERYAKRLSLPPDRYSPFQADVVARQQERLRHLVKLLVRFSRTPINQLQLIEVGCGHGNNLLELIQLGADPSLLRGNELLPDRLEAARLRLPASLQLLAGDACGLAIRAASVDAVYQSTVFSSILDDDLRRQLASAMWSWVRPGGGVIWYDFTVNNPRNADVRGVPLSEVRRLFPQGIVHARRVTLAPPLARVVVKVHPALYTVFNALPLLRTHVLCWIQKAS